MATTIWYDCLDATHLLFIDADMGFSPDVIADMLTLGEPLVGCIYPQRRLPLSWAGSGTGEAMAERRGNFMRVEGVGMGCTLIHRSVIKAVIEKYPELEDKRIELHPAKETLKNAGTQRILRLFDPIDIPDRGKVSEDLSFCIRAGQAGIPCWAAIGHRISHVGPYDYGARYLDSVEAAHKAAEAEAAGATDAQVEAIAQAVQTAVAMAEEQAAA